MGIDPKVEEPTRDQLGYAIRGEWERPSAMRYLTDIRRSPSSEGIPVTGMKQGYTNRHASTQCMQSPCSRDNFLKLCSRPSQLRCL